MKPKLTIGMAVFDDYDGVYFTTQALRMYHDMRNVELVVVDNNPNSVHGKTVKQLLEKKLPPLTAGTQYVAMPSPVGTSAPRQKVFDAANGEIVLCLDSHVLLQPGAIDKLIAWFDKNPDSMDLVSGPMVADSLMQQHTHFNNEWRAGMWGTWGQAWKCSCNRKDSLLFSPMSGENNTMRYVALDSESTPVTFCGSCQAPLPVLEHAGHEPQLLNRGYTILGINDDDEFEIPGQGLGAFACRKSAWLGFNEHFRQFGGEEMYIHTKFRQHGRRCLCLGLLKWVHRFGRPSGARFPLSNWGKLRNYVLGHNELGIDLDKLRQHFVVDGKLVTENQYNYILADPINNMELPNNKPACGASGVLEKIETVDALFAHVGGLPRDLDQHFSRLAEFASICPRITEFSKRRESAIALAKGKPETLVSYNLESSDEGYKRLQVLLGETMSSDPKQSTEIATIAETDLLFIDSQHTFKRLTDELTKFAPSVTRYIVMHDTFLHREKGEDGGSGLLTALRKFMQTNPQWSVVFHTNEQHGLTVIGCRAEDKPALPSTITMAGNFAKAVASHVVSGAKNAPVELLQARLEQCSICPQRVDNRCSICGCYIEAKAAMLNQPCPIGSWPMEAPK